MRLCGNWNQAMLMYVKYNMDDCDNLYCDIPLIILNFSFNWFSWRTAVAKMRLLLLLQLQFVITQNPTCLNEVHSSPSLFVRRILLSLLLSPCTVWTHYSFFISTRISTHLIALTRLVSYLNGLSFCKMKNRGAICPAATACQQASTEHPKWISLIAPSICILKPCFAQPCTFCAHFIFLFVKDPPTPNSAFAHFNQPCFCKISSLSMCMNMPFFLKKE